MVDMPTSSQWLAFLIASILFIQVENCRLWSGS